jgi:anti-sigma factor RsiW
MTPIRCDECTPLLPLYGDGELDAAQALAVEQHTADCARCKARLTGARELRAAIRRCAPYYRAPDALRQHWDSSPPNAPVSATATAPSRRWQRWIGALAACLVLSLAVNTRLLMRDDNARLSDELLNAHLRSLMADHPADVQSTDQHTVKPWFAGKLDFSPPVRDLASVGFPLAGGRLDYIDHRKVAALIYRRRLHVINLFVWPSAASFSLGPDQQTVTGYNVIHWRADGMEWWAISDLNTTELEDFARQMRKSL